MRAVETVEDGPDGMNGFAAYYVLYSAFDPSGNQINRKLASEINKLAQAKVAEIVNRSMLGGWTPSPTKTGKLDRGAFGKSVGAQLLSQVDKSVCLRPNVLYNQTLGNFRTNVGVNMTTGKLEAFGIKKGTRHVVELDLVFFEDGYDPKIGDQLDADRIIVYEVKSSFKGTVDPDQIARQKSALKAMKQTQPVRLRRITTSHHWSTKLNRFLPSKMGASVSALSVMGLASTVGAGVNTAYAIATSEDDPELRKALDDYSIYLRAVKDGKDPYQPRVDAAISMAAYIQSLGLEGADVPTKIMLERAMASQERLPQSSSGGGN